MISGEYTAEYKNKNKNFQEKIRQFTHTYTTCQNNE